jgi:hypothetical protein
MEVLMEKTGFLEESPGVKSSTRLVFIVGSFLSVLIAGYMCYIKLGNPLEIGIFLTGSISAFGGAKYFGTKNEAQ